jgi:hypothetical protein
VLFQQYLSQLRQAKRHADVWWNALIQTEEKRTPDRKQALRNVRIRWPVGPVAHRFVITAVRSAWLQCAALNAQVPELQRVRPEELVLGWLMHTEEELAAFLSSFPYWPIGMDDAGNWK